MRWLTDVAGDRWCDKFVGEQVVEMFDGVRTIALEFAYSMSEPRIEIVAARSGTLWEATGVHHLGYWSDDVDHDVALLAAAGMAVEAKGRDPFGTVLWAYCNGPSGTRIELVSRSLEPILSELFAKGRLDDMEGIDA
jgi:hypothetical protein